MAKSKEVIDELQIIADAILGKYFIAGHVASNLAAELRDELVTELCDKYFNWGHAVGRRDGLNAARDVIIEASEGAIDE